ncbi:MAG: exodeoxyribonuclease V subunit gamma [Chlorobiaceae bacterium]|nr:exodeoxyribonuclease V subunit gamma [Chlorobiaceae bacterium]
MSLRLCTSNRMEALIDAFADLPVGQPLASAFASEVVLVQSRGMQRWISMQLAARLGVWGGAEYPFPNAFVQQLFDRFGLSQPDSVKFSKEAMCWAVMRLLPGLLHLESFAPLRSYLLDDRDDLKLFQLSGRIADTFDQYTLFRPDMLAAWEEGDAGDACDWQQELWRALVAGSSGMHRGRMKAELCRKIGHAPLPPGFPTRISLFGISYLPPFHIDILEAMATRIPVNIFLLSPTKAYWSDIVDRRRLLRMSEAERELSTEGNPLLASLGRNGRDFSDLLLEVGGFEVQDECYLDPGHATLLHTLQSDMLELTGTAEDGEQHAPPEPSDRSVQVHSCHNPLREVEVLHDNLLDLFDHIPRLEPRDIVVMTPDIETYAPYIATVFGGAGEGGIRLPHSIADRRMLDEGGLAPAMLKLLALHGSRFTATELFDLLSSQPVSRRFRLDDEEIDTIRQWVAQTRIRWGMDERSRSGLGLPPYRENSWRAGLDRLLLGYAMPDEGRLHDGTLPFDVEGDPEPLGKLADFVDAVESLSVRFNRFCTLEGWRELFIWMLDTFIEADAGSERELAHITSEIDRLSELAGQSGFEAEVPATVMISWLRSRLEQAEIGLGFMTGGITFCAMLPMRSIPFRVVAMIGMNDGAFPRQQRPPGFDLISGEPKKGDRSVRADDRYLFLESILSARDVLYLSYVGQSMRDNCEIPPSVLVSELLDAVDRGFAFPSGEDANTRLVVRHRLQGFNPAYFNGASGLFSYSTDNFRALESRNSTASRPFVEAPLTGMPDEVRTVTIDELVKFYSNPAAFFLEQSLLLKPPAAQRPFDDREPFGTDSLDAYLMRQELLEMLLDGGEPKELFPVFRSRGLLPPAAHGDLVFTQLLSDVREFAAKLLPLEGGEAGARLEVDLELGGFRITGRLEHLLPSGQLLYRCAKMREKDRLRSWILHLVLNATDGTRPGGTLLVMLDRSIRYRPAEHAAARLEDLLSFYRQGLAEPLPFFPRSSLAWAEKAEKTDLERYASAEAAWREGYGGREGEGADPAFRRCFGPEPPFDARFGTIADALLRPMLDHGGKP